jgi:IgGFc binding protein
VLGAALALASAISCKEKRRRFAPLDAVACVGAKGDRECSAAEGGAPGVLEFQDCSIPPAGQAVLEERWETIEQAEQPASCEEALASHSYVGCEFWPTVTANWVQSVFDFAVVVANTGAEPADVEVTRAGETVARATVEPLALETLYLPWVDWLRAEVSFVEDGAYKLTSTRPVVAYQFNPIEFDTTGGPPGKDWRGLNSQSFSNDASVLLPIQALGTSYRGMTLKRGRGQLSTPFIAITATAGDTTVTVYAPPNDGIAEGFFDVPAIPAGTSRDFTLDAGDVLQLFAADSTLAGSLVEADKPIQVIGGDTCANVPYSTRACDHLEETIPPAQTLGQLFLVAPPTGPAGEPIPYSVQFVGNRDGTQLFYPGGKPRGLPDELQAGEAIFVANLTAKFEVVGTHELGLLLFSQGAERDPSHATDPSMSISVPPRQFRTRYVFLAPKDYTSTYADVIAPTDVDVWLDGEPVDVPRDPYTCASYQVLRIFLDPATGSFHTLEASAPIGVQVLGHALYTSYQYPGGFNLSEISTAPIPPVK